MPYVYVENNPIRYSDPLGLAINNVTGAGFSAGAGGLSGLTGRPYVTPAIEGEATKLINDGGNIIRGHKWVTPVDTNRLAQKWINVISQLIRIQKWTNPIAGEMFQQLFVTRGGDKGKIVPSGSVDDIIKNGLREQNHPTLGNFDDLGKVNLNNPNDIVETIYSKKLQADPKYKKRFENGATLLKVKPGKGQLQPAGRTNMGPKGISQFKVKGKINSKGRIE